MVAQRCALAARGASVRVARCELALLRIDTGATAVPRRADEVREWPTPLEAWQCALHSDVRVGDVPLLTRVWCGAGRDAPRAMRRMAVDALQLVGVRLRGSSPTTSNDEHADVRLWCDDAALLCVDLPPTAAAREVTLEWCSVSSRKPYNDKVSFSHCSIDVSAHTYSVFCVVV